MGASNQQYPDYSKPRSQSVSQDTEYPDYSQPRKSANDDQSFLSKLPRNIIAGLAQMGHGLINTPHNVANLISPDFAKKIPKQKDYDYPELLNLPKEATIMDRLVRGGAQYAPAMMLPVAEMGIAGEAASLLPRMGAQAVPQAAFGATQNENPLHGAAEGAIAGAGGELAMTGLERVYNALKPSSLFRGVLSKEQLQKNLEATRGTNTALGRVIESPSLNRTYENTLPYIMGSGAENMMQQTTKQVTNRGENLLEKIRGDVNPGNTGVELQKALKSAKEDARSEKNARFDTLNKAADKAGLHVGRKNFSDVAHDILNDIDESPELKAEFGKDLYKDFMRYENNEAGNNLKRSNIFRGKLGSKARQFAMEGNEYEAGIINRLKDALSKDIDESFENHGSQELKDMYAQNQKDYAEKYAPFKDPDIRKFTDQGGDPDMLLTHFLRGGKNDRAFLLSKLSQKLAKANTPEANKLLSFAHFSRAVDKDGNFDPVKLSTLYRNLGENQKKLILPDKNDRVEFENYSNLVGKNKEAYDLMRNPKTGARISNILVKIAQIFGGTAFGGLQGLVSLAATGVAAKGATKALTSEKLRTNLIKKMIEAKQSQIPGKKVIPGMLQMELNTFKGYGDNNE